MTHSVNRQIVLKSRPEGAPSLDNFELRETSVPQPREAGYADRTDGRQRMDHDVDTPTTKPTRN